MRRHAITVRKRRAAIDDRVLVQGTANADCVALNLDAEWDGLTLSVAFEGSGAKVSPAANADGTYTVPHEVMAEPGSVSVAIEGRSGGEVLRHCRPDAPFVVRAADGPGGSVSPADPTLSEYRVAVDQVRETLAQVSEIKGQVAQALAECEAAIGEIEAHAVGEWSFDETRHALVIAPVKRKDAR